jgi:hypothetical protein
MPRKPERIRHVGWSALDFASVGLAAASGRLPLHVYMAYLHAPLKRPRRKRAEKA